MGLRGYTPKPCIVKNASPACRRLRHTNGKDFQSSGLLRVIQFFYLRRRLATPSVAAGGTWIDFTTSPTIAETSASLSLSH